MKLHQPPFKLCELKIEVTHCCPLSCIHCSSDAGPSAPREMTEEQCLGILDEAIKMGAKEVAFSGGEPLIWSGLNKAITFAVHGGLKVIVYTSGNVHDVNQRIKELLELGVSTCIFSIFGPTNTDHEMVTRIRGSFSETQRAVNAAVDQGLRTELHFVPLANNFMKLRDIGNISKEWGVSKISVLRFVPQGRGALIQKWALNKIQNIQLKRSIIQLRSEGFDIRTGSPYNFLLLNDQPECFSGIDRLIIGPDLRIFPCDAFKQIRAEEIVDTLELSSLEANNLAECWEYSPFLEAIREYLTTDFMEPCFSCKVLEKCLSGCLAQKVIENGDLEKRPDPMCLMI